MRSSSGTFSSVIVRAPIFPSATSPMRSWNRFTAACSVAS